MRITLGEEFAYKIALLPTTVVGASIRIVTGFPVYLPGFEERICVRELSERFYAIDHYDTGTSISRTFANNAKEAAAIGVDQVNQAKRLGAWEKAITWVVEVMKKDGIELTGETT